MSSTRLSPGKAILFSTIVVIVLLGGLELGLRIWANYFRLAYLTYDQKLERPVLVPNARVINGNEKVVVNSKGFVGPEFEKIKPNGVYRIIALGDSCTFAGGWYETTYSGMLATLLKELEPTHKYEVINAGISGYNSQFALNRLKDELLDYNPDLVSIYIGWNDLMKINPANPQSSASMGKVWRTLNESYLLKAYSKVLFFYLRPLLFKPVLEADPDGTKAFDKFVPQAFLANLDEMASLLRQRGIKTILVTRPTVVHLGMTQDDLDKNNVFFPYYAGTYSLERFLSLHRSYNTATKQIAEKYGIPLVDLDEIFDRGTKDSYFIDTMHLSEEGNQLVANSLVGVIAPESNRHLASNSDL